MKINTLAAAVGSLTLTVAAITAGLMVASPSSAAAAPYSSQTDLLRQLSRLPDCNDTTNLAQCANRFRGKGGKLNVVGSGTFAHFVRTYDEPPSGVVTFADRAR